MVVLARRFALDTKHQAAPDNSKIIVMANNTENWNKKSKDKDLSVCKSDEERPQPFWIENSGRQLKMINLPLF